MPCFAKPFVFWILICLLLLLVLWIDIESSVCLNLPQNGHAQADFGGQGSQPHIEFSDVGLLSSGQHIVVQFTKP